MSAAADGPTRTRTRVLGAPVDVTDRAAVLQRIAGWAQGRESRVVCFSNVHAVVTQRRDASFARAIEAADLALPDGAPVAWMLRRLGHRTQRRIAGPDLMQDVLAQAADAGTPVFLLGGTPDTLARLRTRLRQRWPALQLAGDASPPFRALDEAEDAALTAQIRASGAALVLVGLGCPKQELWMAAHAGRVQAVMLGLGAAFDFHAGTVRRAPRWMQRLGLEWLHRLASEPRRLGWRYLDTNTAFVLGAARQLLSRALGGDAR